MDQIAGQNNLQKGVEAEVVVAGGGMAGLAAAVASARAGAQVCLIEQYGFLGGAATAGLVNIFQVGPPVNGQEVIRGIFEEICDRLSAYGAVQAPGETRVFAPEPLKLVAYQLCEEAGVRLLLHTVVCGVQVGESNLAALQVSSKAGLTSIRAKAFVDATGDGDLAAYAGAPFQVGRDSDGHTQSMTLIFRLGNIVPGQCVDVDRQELSRLFREETGIVASRGRIQLPGPDSTELTLNATHVAGLSALDAESLTQAERIAHRQARAVWEFYREHVPGCEGCVLAETAPHIGIRESRRILGDYVLTREDVLFGKKFEDSIGCSTGWVDIHNPDGEGVLHEFVRAEDWYEIPYRSLTVIGLDNLLVAGRCISATHEAISAVRVIPTCIVTGQGAGVAAALAAKKGCPVRQVSMQELQSELSSQDAFVGRDLAGG